MAIVSPGPVFTSAALVELATCFDGAGVFEVVLGASWLGVGVVGAAGAGAALAKVIAFDNCGPLAVPKEIVQVTPAAIWAAVGGQGNLAASLAALAPALSVPLVGGPTVPV